MFKYQRTIRLSETDATGALYFSELLKLATETFEAFLISKGFSLHQMIEREDFSMPIVNAQAEFFSPLKVGDQVDIHLHLSHKGTSSFTLATSMQLKGREAGKTSIVHVVVSKKTGKSMPIPSQVLQLLA